MKSAEQMVTTEKDTKGRF